MRYDFREKLRTRQNIPEESTFDWLDKIVRGSVAYESRLLHCTDGMPLQLTKGVTVER